MIIESIIDKDLVRMGLNACEPCYGIPFEMQMNLSSWYRGHGLKPGDAKEQDKKLTELLGKPAYTRTKCVKTDKTHLEIAVFETPTTIWTLKFADGDYINYGVLFHSEEGVEFEIVGDKHKEECYSALVEKITLKESNDKEKRYVWAIDFDGVFVEHAYPLIGKPNMKIIEFAKKIKERGDYIILWTCRCGDLLNDAVVYLRNAHGIEFDAINDNLQFLVDKYNGSNSRKVSADYYIDDKNVLMMDLDKYL